MLEIKEVSCGYDGKDVVKNVSISVNRGENLCIIGPNGCGKSTILKAIANLLEYKGEISLDSNQINKLNRIDLAKSVALMTQASNIYFPYTVEETVLLGRYPYIKGVFSKPSKKDEEIVLEAIKNVGLLEMKDKLINELSGGQLQRVYLARAFAQSPDIILLDEPTNHLDLKCQIEILDYLRKWIKENNKIVIAVLHDLNLVHTFADKVAMMENGVVVSQGLAKKVLEREKLKSVYGVDVKSFMLNALKKWEDE